MFSMKYTSPKVTPKKGVAPSMAATALDPSHHSASISSSANRQNGGDFTTRRNNDHSADNGFTRKDDEALQKSFKGDDYAATDVIVSDNNTNQSSLTNIDNMTENRHDSARLQMKSLKINNGITATLDESNHLTKDDTISSHDSYSIMSENDSAVAKIGPRSNLLALLDKAYVESGMSDDDNKKKKMLLLSQKRSDGNKSTEQNNADSDPIVAKYYCVGGERNSSNAVDDENMIVDQEEHNSSAVDDETTNDIIDFDQMQVSDGDRRNLKSTESSSTNLPKAYDFQEKPLIAYRRTTSMEPLVLFDMMQEDINQPTLLQHTALVEEQSSVDVAPPIVGQTNSLPSSLSDGEEEVRDNDARLKTPITHHKEKNTNPSSTQQPASPIMSEQGDAYGDDDEPLSLPIILESPAHSDGATESEIGGDTYFEPDPPLPVLDETKPRSDSIEDDLVHVTLPPRVNRTTSNGKNAKDISTPFLPDCPSTSSHAVDPPGTKQSHPLLPPISPRQPFVSQAPNFSHTHSLLDDCSDEEDELTSFRIVDSPTRHTHSYSCLPRPRSNSDEGSSPFSAYFKKQKQQQAAPGNNAHPKRHTNSSSSSTTHNSASGTSYYSSANQVASNNIQQALLKTRHRRWDCQSAYAGPHAQSKEVFDISNRGHCIAGYLSENGDVAALAARLSVSVEAVRAAALASGLWRTVRLVRLPRGLFWNEDNSEIWALLRMLHSTFPMLQQIDFGGDISRVMSGADDIASTDNDWRTDILVYIMECIPNLVAIDGFAVEKEQPSPGVESHNSSEKDPAKEAKSQLHEPIPLNRSPNDRQGKGSSPNGAVDSAAACGDCRLDCELDAICGLSNLVDSQAENSQLNTSTSATVGGRDLNDSMLSNDGITRSNHAEGFSRALKAEQFDVGEVISFDATEDVSDNMTSLVDRCASADSQNEQEILGSPSNESTDDRMRKSPTLSLSSSMLSSRSWGSNGSGSRPPPCPNSATRSLPVRLPKKPKDRKKSKGSFIKTGTNRLKRRVLGLIPSVSMMDEEEEDDDDSEGSEDAVETECPTDLL